MLDYPSVSHINSVAQENNFLIMFAVIDKYREAYKALAERITGSDVSLLEADGSNIIDIVTKRYDEITTSIKVNTEQIVKREYKYQVQSPNSTRFKTKMKNVDSLVT